MLLNHKNFKIMFDQILDLVKQQMGSNPQIASAIPAGQQEQVHKEIASHVTNGLASQVPTQGGVGGLLSKLQGAWHPAGLLRVPLKVDWQAALPASLVCHRW